MAAVVGRGVHVGRRLEAGALDGGANARVVVPGWLEENGHRVDAADRDPRRSAFEGRGGADETRAVATERHRRETVRRATGRGQRDGRQQLAHGNRRQVDAEEEVGGRDGPLAARAQNRERRVEGDEERRQVIRRVVRANVAADRAPVPHLHVRDLRGHLCEDRARDLHLGREHDLRIRRHRADLEGVARHGDSAQLVEPVQVDQRVRGGRARLHDVDQRLASGERPRALVGFEQAHRFFDGGRARVLDLTQEHAVNLTHNSC